MRRNKLPGYEISEYRNREKSTDGRPVNIVFFIILLFTIIIISGIMYRKSNDTWKDMPDSGDALSGQAGGITGRESVSTGDGEPDSGSILISGSLGTVVTGKGTSAAVTKSLVYDTDEDPVFASAGGLLIKCTGDDIRAYDSEGTEVWDTGIRTFSPALSAEGSWIALSDVGSRRITVFNTSNGNKKWDIEAEGNIISARINGKGYLCVLHEAKNSRSAFSLYDSKGVRIFTSYFSGRYAFSARISPDGRQLLVNTLDASGIKAFSEFEFADMLGNHLGMKITYGNLAFPVEFYMSGNVAVAAGENTLICFDADNGIRWKQIFQYGKIACAGICAGKYVVAAIHEGSASGDVLSEETKVMIFDNRGEIYRRLLLEGKVLSMAIYGSVAAFRTEREVHFYSVKGEFLARYISTSEIRDFCLLSASKAAIAGDNGRVVFIRFN